MTSYNFPKLIIHKKQKPKLTALPKKIENSPQAARPNQHGPPALGARLPANPLHEAAHDADAAQRGKPPARGTIC
jgi:hypothetical protein